MSSSATAPAVEPAAIGRPSAHWLASPEKRSAVLCLLLVTVTLAFYNPIGHNGFTNLDDDIYILDNAHVRAGLTWDTVKWAFTSYDAANWHPLTWLSHALDCELFKLNPAGPHYVNVVLHAWSAVLLFLLLESATGLIWPSLMVAALFALHPVNVESVAWAAERKNVLSMLFFLLTLHAYQWYVRRGGGVKRYAVVAALFALGLMAKSEIITLPFVLLLWDYWPLRRLGGRSAGLGSQFSVLSEGPAEERSITGAGVPRSFSFLFLEKAPLLLLSAVSGVLTLLAQRAGHAVRTLAGWRAVGERARRLCALSGESVLAGAAGGLVSASRRLASGLGDYWRRCGSVRDYCAGVSRARTPLSGDRLALVPGHAGACDRHRLGRRTGDG